MALVRLEPGTSVRFNALGPAILATVGIWWLAASYQAITGRSSRLARWGARWRVQLIFGGLGTLLAAGAGANLAPGQVKEEFLAGLANEKMFLRRRAQ